MQTRLTTGGLALAVLGTVGGLALAQGGYFPRASGATSVLVLWAIAVGLLVAPRVRLRGLAPALLAGLGGLVAWTALSLLWSLDPAQTMIEAERALAYFVVVGGLLLFLRTSSVDAVLAAVAAACALVSVQALLSGRTGDVLEGAIGYSGALGLLAAIGLLLALGFALRAPAALARGLAGAALVALAATLALAGSRAAHLALAVGLAAALALASERRTLLRGVVLLPAPALAAWLAVVASGAALAVALVLLALGSGLMAARRADGVPAPVVAVLALGVLAAGGLAVSPAFDARRTTDSLEVRGELWEVAWHTARERPLLGAGAGSFSRAWVEGRRGPRPARDAHSLYLETAAELGVVGLGLLLFVLAVPVLAAVRARRRPLVPAALGGYAAYLVHAGAHWDWELPALTLAALVCGAALVASAADAEDAPKLAARPRALALGPVLALSAVAFAGVAGHSALARAEAGARAGAVSEAAEQARTAARWQPWSGEPWRLLGEALLAEGERARARASFRAGLRRDRRNRRLWADLSRTGPASPQR